MPNRIFEFQSVRRIIAVLTLMLAVICGLTPASAADTYSSLEDRARFVSISRNLEEAPLKSSLKSDRQWALEWLTNAPDVSVTVCADLWGGLVKSDYPYRGEIVVQYMFSMATRIIEHLDAANDPHALQLAGVEGALAAYRAILKEKPETTSPSLERLSQTQSRGELPDFIRKEFDSCSAKEAEALSK